MKRLSIIVPVYNVEKYLQRCIDSLYNQDIPEDEFEVIVVNDGSTDHSRKILEGNMPKHNNLVLINKNNEGPSIARNIGISKANGRYLIHVDSDDFLEPHSLKNVLEQAELLKAQLLFFRNRFYPGNDVKPPYKFKSNVAYTGEQMIQQGMEISSVWNCIYLKSFLSSTNVQFYKGIAHQDVEYNYRLYPYATHVFFVNDIVYNYNVEGESISRSKNKKKQNKLIKDDIIVSSNIKRYYQKAPFSKELKQLADARMNSTMVSILLRLLKADNDFMEECLRFAHMGGVYPIKGHTVSWKSEILAMVFNNKLLYRRLWKLEHFITSSCR